MAHAITHDARGQLTQVLVEEHRRLERILDEAGRLASDGRFDEARRAFTAFEGAYGRHVRLEEALVFPLFEARTGFLGGPTAALRVEHREAEPALTLMREGLEREDLPAFRGGLEFFESAREDHCAKEDHILFPTLDRLLSAEERAALLRRVEAGDR